MLRQRVVTALILLAVLLPTIFVLPAWTWAAVTLVFLAVGAREWVALLDASAATAGGVERAGAQVAPAGPRAGVVAAGVAIAGLALLGWRLGVGWPDWLPLAVSIAATGWWCLAAPLRLRSHRALGGGWLLAAALLLACWVALIELHALGPLVLLVAMAIVWIADIGAYFVGRAIGRRKLAPAISPGKTWEGAIGGAIAVIALSGLAAMLAEGQGDAAAMLAQTLPVRLFAAAPPALAVLTLAALAALSVVGDLHESLLKREAGVKDSGTLLPGHGGVLDRIDALVPVMPAVLLLHRLTG